MPSQTAQADLIARTYGKCGLDPRNPRERCQYFEAHGTGTAAGDPKVPTLLRISRAYTDDKNRKLKQLALLSSILVSASKVDKIPYLWDL